MLAEAVDNLGSLLTGTGGIGAGLFAAYMISKKVGNGYGERIARMEAGIDNLTKTVDEMRKEMREADGRRCETCRGRPDTS